MSKIDYILRHGPRVFVEKKCQVLKKENGYWKFYNSYDVVIGVDPPIGNQDPYVFHTPWVHAYCHINQLREDTGKQSILIWGSWDQKTKSSNFLVDTVFVVDKKFGWDGDEPKKEFQKTWPYTKDDGLYNDLLKYKSKKNTDRIYTATHFNSRQDNPYKRSDEYYSFIPLKYNNGDFELIDILPLIKENDDEFHKVMLQENQSGIRRIDFAYKIINYLYKNADILVTKVLDGKSIENIDEELQRRYFPLVYGIGYDQRVFKECFKTDESFR